MIRLASWPRGMPGKRIVAALAVVNARRVRTTLRFLARPAPGQPPLGGHGWRESPSDTPGVEDAALPEGRYSERTIGGEREACTARPLGCLGVDFPAARGFASPVVAESNYPGAADRVGRQEVSDRDRQKGVTNSCQTTTASSGANSLTKF